MASSVFWKVSPNSLIAHVKAETESQVTKIAERIFNGVVSRSPVDTGSFRGAWTVSIGSPNYKYDRIGAKGSPAAAPTYPGVHGFKLGQSVYVTNAAPYSLRLEQGWSKQAPAGVLRVTIASLRLFGV